MEDKFIPLYNDTKENISNIVYKKIENYISSKYPNTKQSLRIGETNLSYIELMNLIDPSSKTHDKDIYSKIDTAIKYSRRLIS